MAKEDVVSAGVAAVQAAEISALSLELGKAYDAGLAEAPVSGPAAPSEEEIQARIDAAVLAKSDADAQALADAKIAGDLAIADMQAKLDSLALKEGQEASVISGLQGAKDQLAAVLASLLAIGAPAPAPVDPAP